MTGVAVKRTTERTKWDRAEIDNLPRLLERVLIGNHAISDFLTVPCVDSNNVSFVPARVIVVLGFGCVRLCVCVCVCSSLARHQLTCYLIDYLWAPSTVEERRRRRRRALSCLKRWLTWKEARRRWTRRNQIVCFCLRLNQAVHSLALSLPRSPAGWLAWSLARSLARSLTQTRIYITTDSKSDRQQTSKLPLNELVTRNKSFVFFLQTPDYTVWLCGEHVTDLRRTESEQELIPDSGD